MKIDSNNFKEALSILSLATSKLSTDREIMKMIELSTDNGVLYGYTCDGFNSLRVKIDDTKEDFKVVTNFMTLNDVIKVCDGVIEIKDTEKGLSIKADNMKCKIPTYVSNNGKTGIPHPDIVDNTESLNLTTVEIKDILAMCKSILVTDFPVICYRHIYFDDYIMVTDANNVAIIKNDMFNESMLLSLKSLEILNKLNDFKYSITKETTLSGKDFKKLHISTDIVDGLILSFDKDEYQYSDFIELFSNPIKNKSRIEKESFSKAVSTAKLFKSTILLVFGEDGTSIQVPGADFVYKLNTTSNEPHTYKLNEDVLKKLLTINDDFDIYFDSNDYIKCCSEIGIEEILSVEEIKNETI